MLHPARSPRRRSSALHRLDAFLADRPGEWVDGRELATVAGTYGWRTRVSELRTVLGRDVRNRLTYFSAGDGRGFVVSEYRLVRH